MQIKDKRVIVTGAAGGLGMTISRELLRNGASVSTCHLDNHRETFSESDMFVRFSQVRREPSSLTILYNNRFKSSRYEKKRKKTKTKTLAVQFTRFTILSCGLSFFSKTLQ